MATFTADAAQAGVQPRSSRLGLVTKVATYSFPTSISAGTTIQMIKVAAGETPIAMWVSNTNAGQATVQVGDGNVPARYYTETTLSGAMGTVFCNQQSLAPYTYSVDDTLDIVISRVSVSTLGGAVYLTAILAMET
jgi:hypothetical protein